VRGRPCDGNPDAEGGEDGGAGELGEGERGGNVAAVAANRTGKRSGAAMDRGGERTTPHSCSLYKPNHVTLNLF
jgi:hypothetical protein